MRESCKLAHSNLIVDIDVKDRWDAFRLLKACYQFNWIPRRVFRTHRGYHIKFPTLKHSFILRMLFEDDPNRIGVDMDKTLAGCSLYTNVCFRSTEEYEVKL